MLQSSTLSDEPSMTRSCHPSAVHVSPSLLVEVVELLLANGAKMDLITSDGATALSASRDAGHQEVV